MIDLPIQHPLQVFSKTAPQSQGGFLLRLNFKIKPYFIVSNDFMTAVQIKRTNKCYSTELKLFSFKQKSSQISLIPTISTVKLLNFLQVAFFQVGLC